MHSEKQSITPTETTVREDVERLAREVMGWKKSRLSNLLPASRQVDDLRWWVEGGAPVANVAEWNPFTDADDDEQVLDRCRALWYGTGDMDAHVRWVRFGARLIAAPYAIGDYARAALHVLKHGERRMSETVQVGDAGTFARELHDVVFAWNHTHA